jgi:hypothetical protein
MPQVAALYGFEFTTPFSAGGLEFRPLHGKVSTAKALARDVSKYNLTGTVSAPKLSREQLFRLEAVLSFIEHLEVTVSEPLNDAAATGNPEDFFEMHVFTPYRHNGGGAVLGSDAFGAWRDSRSTFIELALKHLADAEYCQRTRFNSLLFKSVETFRQRRPFLEISWFLLISGLEAFSRGTLADYTSSAAVPITSVLKNFGFSVYQDSPANLPRSVSTYLHIRNALFHQGDYSATVKMNDSEVTLDCQQYFFNLQMLTSLTVMKAIGFDDGHTNWDCWIDRQLHM